MIKGKSIIELTNVNTGEVKRYENDNLVTNAISNFIRMQMAFFDRTQTNNNLPLHEHLLGGILLFDKTIEEHPDNIYIPDPTVSRMIGHAGSVVSTGDDTTRGSRNLTESCEIPNGHRMVFDFATSEANGTINSLSLTHAITGYYGYSLPFDKIMNDASVNYPIVSAGRINRNDINNVYSYRKTSSKLLRKSNGGIELEETQVYMLSELAVRVRKVIYSITNIKYGMKMGRESVKTVEDTDYEIPAQSLMTEYNNYSTACEDDDYYYLFATKTSTVSNEFSYIAIGKNTGEIKHKTITTEKMISKLRSGATKTNIVVRNGHAYIPTQDKCIIKVALHEETTKPTQKTIVSELKTYSSGSNLRTETLKLNNGTIITNGYIIDLDDNAYPIIWYSVNGYFNTTSDYICSSRVIEDLVYVENYVGTTSKAYIYPNPFYIGTINNLETPVVKTNEETMKIIYELTKVDDEEGEEIIHTGFGNAK